MAKRALACGVTGQDGSCLAELLLDKGYESRGLAAQAYPSEGFPGSKGTEDFHFRPSPFDPLMSRTRIVVPTTED